MSGKTEVYDGGEDENAALITPPLWRLGDHRKLMETGGD